MSLTSSRSRNSSYANFSLHIEQLEDRRLLAVDLRLLKDINRNLSAVELSDNAEMGGVRYLGARTSSGFALWRTDGTDTGTLTVGEFNSELRNFTVVNSTLFFVVDSEFGRELWKSDGTRQGTAIVRDINPGIASSYPRYLTNVGGVLYFSAKIPQTGMELWKSDGTAAGTVQVRDIVSGSGDSNPKNLTAVGSTLYFTAQSVAGTELFKSNGSSVTTVLVRDLAPGPASSNPTNLVNLGGTLYFSASISTTNSGLWKTNGTAATTTQVKNLQTTTDTISDALVINNRIYFAAAQNNNRELWTSDGTQAGTLMVRDISPGPSSSDPRNFVEFGGQLFFSAKGAAGRELWRSNGTPAGTFQVKDIFLGSADSSPDLLQRVGPTLYFVADDGINGRELWKTNGTAAGTFLVKDLFPGPGGSFYSGAPKSNITSVSGKIMFVATANTPDTPRRVWTSAGTAETTTMLRSIGKETADSIPQVSSPGFVNLNGTIYFIASSGSAESHDLWKTNGTSAGTVLVKHFAGAGIRYSNLINMAGTLYFVAADTTNGINLWKSDGTTAGTSVVPSREGTNPSTVEQLTAAGNILYFTDALGRLWKCDGPTTGMVIAQQFAEQPRILFTIGSTVYLAATNLVTGYELWKHDDTINGTVLVKEIRPGTGSSSPSRAVKVGTKYYFTANDGTHGSELWSTEGTSATTVLVKDIFPGAGGSYATEMTAVGSTLYFASRDGLWKSNGTEESTVKIFESTSTLDNLVNVSGQLFFTVSAEAQHGRELWKSDGTIFGTSMVKDIQPGPISSQPEELTNIGGRLYFSAYTNALGRELWSSNGTAAGTILEKDLNAGILGSSPRHMIVLEDQLILVAAGANAGREIFAEPKSIIGPNGEGESSQVSIADEPQPLVAWALLPANASAGKSAHTTARPAIKHSSEQVFDLALLDWSADEFHPTRKSRVLLRQV